MKPKLNDVDIKYSKVKYKYNIRRFKREIKRLFKFVETHYSNIPDINMLIKQNLVKIYNNMLPTTENDIIVTNTVNFPYMESKFNHRLMNKDINKALNFMVIKTNNPDMIDEDEYTILIEKKIKTHLLSLSEYLLFVHVNKL